MKTKKNILSQKQVRIFQNILFDYMTFKGTENFLSDNNNIT